MSAHELIQAGSVFANQAIECDRSACTTNDPKYYRSAEANYSNAVAKYSQALGLEVHPSRRNVLQKKIDDYRNRCAVMTQWLSSYQQHFERPKPRPTSPESSSRSSGTTSGGTVESEDEDNIPTVAVSPSAPPPLSPLAPPKSTYAPAPTTPVVPRPPALAPYSHRQPQVAPVPIVEGPKLLPRPGHRDSASMPDCENISSGMAALVLRAQPGTRFSDVAGLSHAKEVLTEATSSLTDLPHLSSPARQPWRTILIYGSSRTGKTMVTRAAAAEAGASLLTVNCELLIEQSEREGSTIVSEVFKDRNENSVLLLRDIDLLFPARGERDANFVRRTRTRLLRELDATRDAKVGMIVVATTRSPWLLEEAFLRRMDQRVYVRRPDAATRAHLLDRLLRSTPADITLKEAEDIAGECVDYTPADLELLVREASMEPVRALRAATHFRQVEVRRGADVTLKWAPTRPDVNGAVRRNLAEVPHKDLLDVKVCCLDFEVAMEVVKAVREDERYEEFRSQWGGIDG